MRLIDADKEIAEMDRLYPCLVDEADKQSVRYAKLVLEGADTIDAEPVRHGRWIEYSDNTGLFYCNLCGYIYAKILSHDYCPNCGAKMDESEVKKDE